MNVVVTGASGFLGRHVVAALLRDGHHVCAMVRRAQALDAEPGSKDLRIVQADLTQTPDLTGVLHGADAVIHLAFAMTGAAREVRACALSGTRHLIEAMPDKGCRLILASSFAVYDWLRMRSELNEDSPLLDEEASAMAGVYAHAKVQQETLAREMCAQRRIGLTILRPATVWGRGHPGLDVVGPRARAIRFVVSPRRPVHLTYVEHCADAFVAALHDSAASSVFNVEDGVIADAHRYAGLMDPHAHKVKVPSWALGLVRLIGPLTRAAFKKGVPVPGLLIPERAAARFPAIKVDNSKLRHVLRWQTRYSFDEACARAGATGECR